MSALVPRDAYIKTAAVPCITMICCMLDRSHSKNGERLCGALIISRKFCFRCTYTRINESFLIIDRLDEKHTKGAARSISPSYTFSGLISLPDLWQWRVGKERDRRSEMSMKRTFSFPGTDKSKRNTDDWFTPALRGFSWKQWERRRDGTKVIIFSLVL